MAATSTWSTSCSSSLHPCWWSLQRVAKTLPTTISRRWQESSDRAAGTRASPYTTYIFLNCRVIYNYIYIYIYIYTYTYFVNHTVTTSFLTLDLGCTVQDLSLRVSSQYVHNTRYTIHTLRMPSGWGQVSVQLRARMCTCMYIYHSLSFLQFVNPTTIFVEAKNTPKIMSKFFKLSLAAKSLNNCSFSCVPAHRVRVWSKHVAKSLTLNRIATGIWWYPPTIRR
jgi:hypothetical protein